MSAIVTVVYKTTIGLLVDKGYDKLVEMLKDGDVTDQKFHALIVREIDDINSKLAALSRKDLGASISFFQEGIGLLYEVFDKSRSRSEYGAVAAAQATCYEAFSLAEEVRRLELTGLNGSATRKLSNAKKRFEDARRKATEAFKNEGLKTPDRILAMQYRVMATILEAVDNPADAVAPCLVCIKELNCLPAVQNSFNIQLKKGIQAVRGLFSKEERRELIARVCRVNRTVYDVTLAVGEDVLSWNWPHVDIGAHKVDPLRDGRVTEVLRKQGMEHYCVSWSFGQEGEKEHKLKDPTGIATNSSGQFIVADRGDGNVKVFDSNGKFVNHFSLPTDDVDTQFYIHDVATDKRDNIFVLTQEKYQWVYKFTETGDLHNKFSLWGQEGVWSGVWYSLSVSDRDKVLVLEAWGYTVCEYETDGQFVRTFGNRTLTRSWDIAAANDGRVMVVERAHSGVHIFSEHGDHLNTFQLRRSHSCPSIAFHRASERVVVAGVDKDELLYVEMYNKDGEFVRGTQVHVKSLNRTAGITVTTEGRIAVLAFYHKLESKVLVL